MQICTTAPLKADETGQPWLQLGVCKIRLKWQPWASQIRRSRILQVWFRPGNTRPIDSWLLYESSFLTNSHGSSRNQHKKWQPWWISNACYHSQIRVWSVCIRKLWVSEPSNLPCLWHRVFYWPPPRICIRGLLLWNVWIRRGKETFWDPLCSCRKGVGTQDKIHLVGVLWTTWPRLLEHLTDQVLQGPCCHQSQLGTRPAIRVSQGLVQWSR